ncbi:MAG: hypothetical protein E6J91_13040 [Deltaproteobacteria bacterium]|nr:MAG: hypothetical protein E6J91_13040 [Deltaproteobacteria bacterium]
MPARAADACWWTAATCAALCAASDAHVEAAIESICDSACVRAVEAPSSAWLWAVSRVSLSLSWTVLTCSFCLLAMSWTPLSVCGWLPKMFFWASSCILPGISLAQPSAVSCAAFLAASSLSPSYGSGTESPSPEANAASADAAAATWARAPA